MEVEAVRAANDDDAPRLVELVTDLMAGMSRQRGAAEASADGWGGPLGEHLARWLPGSPQVGHAAWIGSFDGATCAFALAHVEEWDRLGRRGVLDACFVEPAARGVGLGRLLLDTCLNWLTSEGCHGVDGPALPGDRSAKNFYEGSGFKARLLTMYRPLDSL